MLATGETVDFILSVSIIAFKINRPECDQRDMHIMTYLVKEQTAII